jgi:Caspase domain
MNILLRCIAALFASFLLVAIPTGGAYAERRVALIIGNAEYQHADTLVNTINDADAITQLFKRAGFDVVDEQKNVGVVDFKRAVRDFFNTARDADIAVVYYSGHGIEVGGANYLIPVDAKLLSAFDVDDEAVQLDRVLLATQPAKRLSLVILDACRENPFLLAQGGLTATRSVATRLIGVEPTRADTLVAYAAKAGSVSYDGVGSNSPFTTALVKYATQPGLDIRIALGKVRDDVMAATNNAQEPFVYGSLGGADISLVPAPNAPDLGSSMVVDFQMAERLGSLEGWRAFLAAHSDGYYAELARAHLAKLDNAEARGKGPTPVDAGRTSPDPQVFAARSTSETVPPETRPAGSQSSGTSCTSDASRLQRLRENPSLGEAKAFSEELQCESLRPQLSRLLESLGAETAPGADAGPSGAKRTGGINCEAGAEALQHLRAHPSLDQVTKFARDLRCEQLRPQVQRLMESLGASQPAANAAGESAAANLQSPASTKRGEPRSADGAVEQPEMATVCNREALELSRIRANPDPAAARRFASLVKCEGLRPQVARLLESLGD